MTTITLQKPPGSISEQLLVLILQVQTSRDDVQTAEDTEHIAQQLQDRLPEWYPRIYRTVAAITYGSGLDAEDLTQDTFFKAFKKLHTFNADSSMYTWLHRIARNTCLDAMRKLKWKRRLGLAGNNDSGDKEQWSADMGGEETLMSREEHRLVRRAMARINADDRELIAYKDLQDMTYPEIGDILEIPEGTVKSRLFKARRALREELNKLGYSR